MNIERLDNIQHDLEDTAAHLDALRKVLEGHVHFLRHSRCVDASADIAFIESNLTGLAASIIDLRGVAGSIARVA
jgi:hypothetical protein